MRSVSLADGLAETLVEICGPEGVIVDEDRLLAYESDGLTAHRHRPSAVVLPRTTSQARRVVRAVAGRGLAVVPRGAGTGLSGGAVALNGAVVLGTARMDRILEIDAPNRRAVVQPGVVNAELSAALRPCGLHYAPDPSSQSACTLGGNVGENSGGPHCLKYGVTSRHVSGLSVVLADGSLVKLGGLADDSAGYDLVGLFVGSEGCFGVATEIEVGLLPLPEGVRTLLGIFDRIDDAGRAVSEIVGAGLLPAAMEIMDGPTIRAVEESVFAAGYPTDAGAALVIEFDGVDAGLDEEAARAAAICERAGAREVRRAKSDEERATLWKGRKKAFGAMGRIAPDLLVQDATVPRTVLPSVLRGIAGIAARHRLSVANVFHAGDGNLHPNISFDRRDDEETVRVERASAEIMRLCVEAGGTITGEHGVGLDKKRYMELVCGPAELEAMRGVRRVFDPAGAMNPGKVLPDPPNQEGLEGAAANGAGARSLGAGGGARGVESVVGLLPASRALAGEGARRWSGWSGAEAVVFPESAEQVTALVRMAAETRTPLIPAGNASQLWDAGWLAGQGGVVVSTQRLNSLDHYEPADLTLTTGGGTTWRDLDQTLRAEAQWLPFETPGIWSGTVAGAVARGGAGPLRTRYGALRDGVLGLEVVTGAGAVLRLGGRVVKNVAGYDLLRLFSGSHGSLGILTRISMRLFPRPEADITLRFEGIRERMLASAASLASSRVPIAAAELGETAAASREGRASLTVRVLGGGAEAESVRPRVESQVGLSPMEVLLGDQSESLHRRATGEVGESSLVALVRALPDRLGRLVALAAELAAAAQGDLRADVLHGSVRVEASPPDEALEAVRGVWERVSAGVREAGGTASLGRAPRGLRSGISRCRDGSGSRRLADGVKRLFDPHAILAPRQP